MNSNSSVSGNAPKSGLSTATVNSSTTDENTGKKVVLFRTCHRNAYIHLVQLTDQYPYPLPKRACSAAPGQLGTSLKVDFQ